MKIGLPACKKDLRSILGFVSFYLKFIPNMTDFSAPLADMLKNSAPDKLVWEDKKTQSFYSLKKPLSSHPILALPNLDKKLYLRTDASGVVFASVLFQYHDDMAMPIF